MGSPRQENWSGLPFLSPGDLPNLGIEPGSPAPLAESLLTELPVKQFHMAGFKCGAVESDEIREEKPLFYGKGL